MMPLLADFTLAWLLQYDLRPFAMLALGLGLAVALLAGYVFTLHLRQRKQRRLLLSWMGEAGIRNHPDKS